MARRVLDASPMKKATTTPTEAQIIEHMPLVQGIVAQFMRKLPRSVQREDLVSAGTLGLFYALRQSSHSCDEMFLAYARIRIRGAIVDELRRHDWSPRRRRAPAPASPPRLSLVPAGGGGGEESAARVQVVSFDDLPPHGGEIAARQDEEGTSPFDDVVERHAHASLHAAVDALPPREREIVRMRYFQGLPSKAIAQAMGLSEARISQLHARATSRLRELLAETGTMETDEVKLAA